LWDFPELNREFPCGTLGVDISNLQLLLDHTTETNQICTVSFTDSEFVHLLLNIDEHIDYSGFPEIFKKVKRRVHISTEANKVCTFSFTEIEVMHLLFVLCSH